MEIAIKNSVLSICLTGVCLSGSIILLYRNLALLSGTQGKPEEGKILKRATILNSIILASAIIMALYVESTNQDRNMQKMLAAGLIIAVILFSGIISPKLPFNKHTGLRLPWTVADEDAWKTAHKILAWIAIPTVLLYLGAVITVPDFEMVTVWTLGLWIGIPGVFSFVVYIKKTKG